eukprot:scaffold313410_cov17-Prasinocladus_malaysianus.AAC.1
MPTTAIRVYITREATENDRDEAGSLCFQNNVVHKLMEISHRMAENIEDALGSPLIDRRMGIPVGARIYAETPHSSSTTARQPHQEILCT